MSNIQLPGSKTFGSHILMHSCTQKHGVSLAKQLQKSLSMEYRKHGFIGQVKYRKIDSKIKCTDREYHAQDNSDVAQKDVKNYCDSNQFPGSPFCGPHPKSHRSRGLIKH